MIRIFCKSGQATSSCLGELTENPRGHTLSKYVGIPTANNDSLRLSASIPHPITAPRHALPGAMPLAPCQMWITFRVYPSLQILFLGFILYPVLGRVLIAELQRFRPFVQLCTFQIKFRGVGVPVNKKEKQELNSCS